MDKKAIDSCMSPGLLAALKTFFGDHPPQRLGQNLRRLLLDYLQHELKTGVPTYLDHLLWDLYYLFEVLDLAAKEIESTNKDNDRSSLDDPMQTHKYTGWELKPRHLSNEEVDDPYLALDNLFSYAHLPQLREILWESLKTMVTGNYNHLSRRERTNLVYFFEHMQKLLEAAHLIHLQHKPENNAGAENDTKQQRNE